MAPIPTTIAMKPRISPIPFCRLAMRSIKGIPAAKPTKTLASNKEMNAWTFSLITKTSNKRMESPVMINKYIVLSIVLPFCYAAVLMPPEGIFPIVPYLRHLPDMLLIDFQSQTRPFRDFHIAVIIFKYILIDDVVQQVAALVVMDPQTLFLYKGIVTGGVHLKAGCQRNWPQRAMRRHGDVKSFGHGEDLFTFGYASRMGQVRLDDIHITVGQQRFELPFGKHPLS